MSEVLGRKHAIPDSTRGRIGDGPLRADYRRLFMLCCAARASEVLINPRSYFNHRARFAHVNGCEHSLNLLLFSCVPITLPASS
jgi:hypothetical protein